MNPELKGGILTVETRGYIQRFGSALRLTYKARRQAIKILKLAKEREITPRWVSAGILAAAIYIAGIQCEERRTQREIAGVVGVSETTLRIRYIELVKKLDLRCIL